ncbi:Lrp/AsnC family transcriptional regulator [Achromobacter piechaudii]|uniref:HTH-type transcriptional regulator LrpC n=2 Tax=Achromobacter piechaudii TaxID=72556 RepID=A0ABM8KRU3_9BURK|nr:Lrp/AsnC family transcriptional regulator [Achromobacter piechaudii]EFF77840.1 transcriptional regulator, AsnC family [Achromobacter piechaudii ATCC 43553]CAB3661443.1 HTH-type transcriptional regulator LrpC [Achromobacter piechaudii]CAB3825432.1 HTH-type transcriptional regulator LrpC [Achromobacter piechaudii]CAB3945087.1 HTH-type transcriptional regulator LrpC [Achromobacter piechaudii]
MDKGELDDIAWRLLRALQTDARAPLKALAQAAGLSVAATAERLKRLQEAGIVQRFAVEVDAVKTGYPVKAIVGITATQPGKKALLDRLRQAPEVLECHHVAGADSYMMTVVATGLADLERFIGTINGYGETRTSIVFSTPIERRGVVPPGIGKRT